MLLLKQAGAIVRLHSAAGNKSDCRSIGHKFKPQLVHITFEETDLISTAILPLLLIHEGHLSVTEESMCISTG